jgi:hypothetical protein
VVDAVLELEVGFVGRGGGGGGGAADAWNRGGGGAMRGGGGGGGDVGVRTRDARFPGAGNADAGRTVRHRQCARLHSVLKE